MFSNYLKIAFRNLRKTRLFSIINILGLAVGMAACLLILNYVLYEQSYDRFHPQSENIYRIRYERTSGEEAAVRFASCCPPAAPLIKERHEEVEFIGRMFKYQGVVSYEDIRFLEERLFYAEPEVFNIFHFNFLIGDPVQDLQNPNSAFISSTIARKYFGEQDPIGKTISLNGEADFQVAGIFADIPGNSHVKFDILLPWKHLAATFGPEYTEEWGHTGAFTYVKLASGTDPSAYQTRLDDLIETELGEALREYGMTMTLPMQPLGDIHLTSHFQQEYEVNGSRDSVKFLFIIAVLIIVMAWVNYVNLSTARSLDRAREVGLRKVVGAARRQLMSQFFLETILINLFSLIVAFGLLEITLPLFSKMAGIPTGVHLWEKAWFWQTMGIMFVAGVLLSGLYPVLIMSSFKPSSVLRGKLGDSTKGFGLRRVLVVLQYTLALSLIAGTITVYNQLAFMKQMDLGFDVEQVLVVKAPRVKDDTYQVQADRFKDELLALPAIQKDCLITEVPGRQLYWDAGGIYRAGADVSENRNYQIMGIDYDFADVFNIEFIQGRNFSREFATDDSALILNETAVKWMGFESSAEALGQKVQYWSDIFTIVGIVKDYHQQSLKEAFEPTIFRLAPYGRGRLGSFVFKIDTHNITQTIEAIQSKYNQFFPGNPFDYFFLDDYFNQQYAADERFGQVFGMFTFLAIFVTSLGILGLSSFMVTRRTKEIGIRKVLGASVSSIMTLISKEFLQLGIIAMFISSPIAWYVMDRWLESYAYRIDIGPWILLLAGIIALSVALLTVGIQSVKAAASNPVDALKYE